MVEEFSKAYERREHEDEVNKERREHENEQSELKRRIKELEYQSWLLVEGGSLSSALTLGLTFFTTKSEREQYKAAAQKLGIDSYYLYVNSVNNENQFSLIEDIKHELQNSHGLAVATAFHSGIRLVVLKEAGRFSPDKVLKSPWMPYTSSMMKEYLSVLKVDENIVSAVCKFWVEWYEKKHLQPPSGQLYFYLLYIYLNLSLSPTLGSWDKTNLQKLKKFLLSASELLSTPNKLELEMKELDEIFWDNKLQ